jgi:hypothetical protein
MNGASEHSDKRSLQAVNLGLLANAGLAALKTSFGILGHSPALLADGINSTSDVAYGIIVKVFIRLARKPADDEHPRTPQLEVAARIVGAFVLTTAVAIFWDAVNGVYRRRAAARASLGAQLAALFTVGLKIWLSRKTGPSACRPATQQFSPADHRNDIRRRRQPGSSCPAPVIRSSIPGRSPGGPGDSRTGLEILRESSGT